MTVNSERLQIQLMKVILSRKGFDAAAGKCPSPIFEDGSFLSLPIPDKSSTVSYAEIGGSHPVGRLVEDLSPLVKASCGVHLDPDLRVDSRQREPGWRPMFGQADAAQQHLRNMKVTKEDFFLFFGWFRRVEQHDGRFRYHYHSNRDRWSHTGTKHIFKRSGAGKSSSWTQRIIRKRSIGLTI